MEYFDMVLLVINHYLVNQWYHQMSQSKPTELMPVRLAKSITIMNSTHVDSIPGLQASIIFHYDDVKMGAMASQITSLTIVYSTFYSDPDQRKHQSSTSLAFVGPVNSPHKWPVTRKMFPCDDVIMQLYSQSH